MTKRFAFLALFSVSLISAIFWNEFNKYELRKAGIALRHNSTVITNDDYSYLAPYDSFLRNGSFYTDELSKYTTVTRSPGYGGFYFVCSIIFGRSNALYCLSILQMVLFALSVYCLFQIAELVTLPRKFAFLIAALYGFLPFSIGFLNYTLTEGVTPALLIFSYLFFFKGFYSTEKKTKNLNYLFAILVFALLFLVRPILGIFIVPMFVVLINDFWNEKKPLLFAVKSCIFLAVAFSLYGIWEIRNREVLGKWTSLHPIYQNEIPGVFRLPHEKAWEFFKGWESSGAHFHETIHPFWEQTMKLDTTNQPIKRFVNRIPTTVVNSIGKEALIDALKSYRKAILAQKPYFDERKVMPKISLEIEKSAALKFSQLAQNYQKKNPTNYFIVTPLKVLKDMTFHSNLSLYIFQVSARGNWCTELLRFVCLAIHFISFLLLPVSLIFNRKHIHLISISLMIITYVSYLAFFQRGIEERYTLPILPFVILLFGLTIYSIYLRLKCRSIF